ncbi:MAG: conjugal transfer protein TraG N-terminal domain-containing protein, partial [Nitrospirae bacterium]|nr:conjugal transfer protein TraG N-terminal domain-containing protein [Nitrospirota bacterium]
MNFTVYTFGNGDVLFDVFTSIVLMTGAGYESLMRLGMICLAFGGITYYLARGRVAMQLFMGAVLVLFTTVTIKATVQVTDLVNTGIPTRVVGNVPLAVAFPAYMASEVGFQLLTLAETAFATTVPPEYQMMNSTFGRGFMDFQKTLGAQLPDSDLQANLTQYLMYCVFPSIGLNQLQKGAIFNAVDALTAIQVTNPVLSVMQVLNGNPTATLTCPDMYNNVITAGMQDGNPDYDLAMKQLRRALNQPDVVDQELTPVGQFITNIINSTQGARQLINNVLIRERWIDAERLASAAGSDTATSVSLMQKQISEDLKTQAFAQSSIAARFLPMMRTMAESGVYMLTPFILALAMTPAMFATIRMASMSYAWLLFWGPAYAMVNYLVYAYGNGQVQSLVTAGTGVTLASYTDFYDFLSQMNSFASTIIWGVPSIAAVAMYGMGSAASALMGGAQTAQHAAHHEANAFAHGRGEHVDSGRHLAWQDQISTDGHSINTVRYVGGEGGILGESQTGMHTVYFSDGGHTTTGRDGMTTYSGPRGSYSQDADGNYVAGVWRQEMQGPDGAMHEAQLQVSGDHVDVQYMTSDAHGTQHDIKMEINQMANEPRIVTDSYSEGGFTKQITSMNDGSKRMSQVGTSMMTVQRNGESFTGPMDVTGNFYQAPGGSWEGVVSAHSTEHGDFHYSLSDVKSDDLGAPDLSKRMTVTSGSGTDQFHLGRNWQGLTVAEQSGTHGEAMLRVFGGGQDVVLHNQDGTQMPLKGMTIEGVGTKNSDETPSDLNVSVSGYANGMDLTAKGRLEVDPETGAKVLEVSDQHWQSRLDGHSSGTMMWVGQEDGQGGYQLNRGSIQYDGDPNQVGTPWHYRGQIKDLTSGQSFNGEMHFDGQNLVMSDMASGSTRKVIGSDGSQIMIQGDPNSPQGANYTKTSAESGWMPMDVDENGTKLYSLMSGQMTETGIVRQQTDEAGKPSSIFVPNNTRLSGTTPWGSFDVLANKTSAPAASIHQLGDLGTQLTASGETGVTALDESHTAKGLPVGGDEPVDVFLPVDGKIGRQFVISETRKEPDGTLTAETQTRDPFTMAVANARREGGVQVNVNNRRVDATPMTIDHIDGVDGPITAYSERTSDPKNPNKPLSQTLLKDTNGDLWATVNGQHGRLQMKMGEGGYWTGNFTALREENVQGNTKFAVTRLSNSEGKQLYEQGKAGENFVTQYNNREEHLSGTTLDTMGLIRDSYEAMGGEVTP